MQKVLYIAQNICLRVRCTKTVIIIILVALHILLTPIQCVADDTVSVFLLSTYTDGSPPESAAWFCQWLREAKDDFRVPKSLLSGLHYAAFGLGDSLYGENYNSAVKDLVDGFKKLSATSIYPLGLGDQNVAQSTHGGTCIVAT